MRVKNLVLGILSALIILVFMTACVQNTTTSRPSETILKPEQEVEDQKVEEARLEAEKKARQSLSSIQEGKHKNSVDPSYFNQLMALETLPENIVTIYIESGAANSAVAASQQIVGDVLFQVNGCSQMTPVFNNKYSEKQIILFSDRKEHAREFYYSLQEDCRIYHSHIFYLYNDLQCALNVCTAVLD